MATTTAYSEAPTARHPRSTGRATKIGRTGLIAGLAAAVATTAIAAGARALDVPMAIDGKVIPLLAFAQLTLFATIIGTGLAAVVSRHARRARRTFVTVTIALTIVSVVPDLMVNASTATKITLALSHLVAAAIVIPALAGRLAE